MSEPFIEKQAISTEPADVNWEKHKRKSHRFFPTESQSESKYESSLAKIFCYFPKPTLLLYDHLQQIFQKIAIVIKSCYRRTSPEVIDVAFWGRKQDEQIMCTTQVCVRYGYDVKLLEISNEN